MTPTNERKRVYGSAACLGLSLAVVVAAGQSALQRDRVVDTQRIVLRDASGRVRAQLYAEPDGTAKIALLDREGRDRLALTASDGEDAAFELYDRGRVQVAIESDSQGRAAVRLFDPKNEGRATLYLSPDSTAGLELLSHDRRIEVATQPDGMGGVVVTDSDGNVAQKLGVLPTEMRVMRGDGGARPFQSTSSTPAQPAHATMTSSPGLRQPVAAAPVGAD